MSNPTNSPDSLDRILYEYVVQRDIYYSDLKDGVISDDEWVAIRDKIHHTTKAKLNSYIEWVIDVSSVCPPLHMEKYTAAEVETIVAGNINRIKAEQRNRAGLGGKSDG